MFSRVGMGFCRAPQKNLWVGRVCGVWSTEVSALTRILAVMLRSRLYMGSAKDALRGPGSAFATDGIIKPHFSFFYLVHNNINYHSKYFLNFWAFFKSMV